MIRRLPNKNINTPEYIDDVYSNLQWDSVEYGQSHLKQEVDLLFQPYKQHLDVGCCDGLWAKLMLEKFPDTKGFGIDHSQVAIDRAKNICPKGDFRVGSVYNLPWEKAEFDLVHSAETIEHLEEPHMALAEMWRVLKPGGELIITAPNWNAQEYEEHLWKWDTAGVLSLINEMKKPIVVMEKFFNGNMLYLRIEKL
jgi:ubiquinone/menaquinone biosynthesis C-methylase UbiE